MLPLENLVWVIAHSIVDGALIAVASLISWRTMLVSDIGFIVYDLTDGLEYDSAGDSGRSRGRKTCAGGIGCQKDKIFQRFPNCFHGHK